VSPPVFSLLAAAAGVTAIIGTSPVRCYPGGEALQGTAAPYIVWQIVSDNVQAYLAGAPSGDQLRVQLDLYATTRDQCAALLRQVQLALDEAAYQISYNVDEREPETRLWRMSVDYDFWVER
jgi:hypothetical protein